MNPYSETYPNSLFINVVPIGGGLVVVYQLDCYERWIVHVRYVLCGLTFEDLFWEVVGRVSEGWLDNRFEDDGFEDWEKFA
jgi:hypothetical protein